MIERAKEEIEALVHCEKSPRHHKETHGSSHHSGKSPRHHKETHGLSDDIDEDTPIDEVKGPGVFERVKEEIEALVEAIHPKK